MGVKHPLLRQHGQLAYRHRAKAQMHAQIARAFERREITRKLITVKACQEVLHQGLCAGCAGLDVQGLQVGGSEANIRKTGHAAQRGIHGLRDIRPVRRVTLCGVGLEIKVSLALFQLLEPRVLIGREHRVGLALLRQQFLALEHHMIFECVQGHTLNVQGRAHRRITRQGLGLVVVVGIHRLHPQALSHAWDFIHGAPVQDDQTGAACAHGLHLRVQIHQGCEDELNPAIGPWQALQ